MNKRNLLRRLLRDRRGAALPLMAAGLLPVLAGIGAAVDIGRIVIVRAQMQAGVDAGALAGARVFGLAEDRDEQVAAYFHANMPEGFAGSDPINPVADFQEVRGVNRVQVTATTDLPMAFMRIFGIEHRPVSVEAVAEMQPKPLEVMVVLDNTGSMNDKLGTGTRMSALKTAMYDFINILHQGEETRPDLAMGFVTYTVTTNVGALLEEADVPIMHREGYTNSSVYTEGASSAAAKALAWGGCVENDQTVQDLSDSAITMENGAFDIDGVLPGTGNTRPGIRPYHYPPNSPTKNVKATGQKEAVRGAYATAARKPENYAAEGNNNFYKLDAGLGMASAQRLANTEAYRQHFYDFYIGLNYDPGTPDDNVIVADDGTPFDPTAGTLVKWKVDYSRVPLLSSTSNWRAPNTKYGYPLRGTKNLNQPTPNWQCPEPALKLAYGQSKKTYDDYIHYENHPLLPASGTLHHIGMLWGYRLLTNEATFKRTNPVPNEKPLRALVFMTDGDTQASDASNWYGAYGALREKRITTSTSNATFADQVMFRFAKVCENAKRDGITVYIVSLLAARGVTRRVFNTCAGANFLETDSQETIQDAFRRIAVDLVDLHLTE